MKLWHDDVRKPPRGWTWAKTNAEAMKLLCEQDIEEISMDHDLGAIPTGDPTDVFLRGDSNDECGLDLARWMCERKKIPPMIWIHSWNPEGADSMLKAFKDHGHEATLLPYSELNYEA